jgi:hypothetical protein
VCLLQPPDCDPAVDCGSWVVYPYFISFVVLVSIIMLQLFTAVIIESFEAQEEQDVSTHLRPAHRGGVPRPCREVGMSLAQRRLCIQAWVPLGRATAASQHTARVGSPVDIALCGSYGAGPMQAPT